jgi:hypothetical protein
MLLATKILVVTSIFFVWVVRYENIVKEFEEYGIPAWVRDLTGILKLTFATGQSYIHFQDLASRETTFLLSRTAKSSPDHHDHILNLAQKLAKLKHGTAGQMKEAALKMKTW